MRGFMLVILYYVKLILVLPGTFLQYIFYNRKINKTKIEKDPIFILGHYRSGTTYLHKLMAADKQFGFVTYYDILCPNTSFLFGNWLQKFLQFIINKLKIKTAFFNNTIPDLSDPAEEERFLINKGSAYTDYWRFVFPQEWKKWVSCAEQCSNYNYYKKWSSAYTYTMKLATFKTKGRQLILKSPENTGRIKYLLEMFPNAKFIYISRNPYDVYYSMMNLWERAIKKFALQRINDAEIETIVFDHYTQLLNTYYREKNLIPAGNLIEIRYDELRASPLSMLRRIYKQLSLPCFENASCAFIEQLRKERNYKTYEYEYKENDLEKIKQQWKQYIDAWNNEAMKISSGHVDSLVAVQVCDATMYN